MIRLSHLLVLGLMASTAGLAGADPALLHARDSQDRPALDKLVADARAAAEKNANDAGAQYRYALAASFQAEVAQEVKDKGGAKHAAEAGIRAAEIAVALDPNKGEYYRVLGTLYGQAVQDVFSALTYGKKAQDAIEKAKQKDPNSSEVWVSDGVGKYYLPSQFGGGPDVALQSLKRAIELDPNNADAWLWLGLAQRKKNQNADARVAFAKSLALNPNRLWAKQQLDKTPAK